MSDNQEIKPIEGEIIESSVEAKQHQGETPPNLAIEDSPHDISRELETDIREAAKRGGVFIGTLNIMTSPARTLLTEPLANLYKNRYEGKFKRPKHVFAFDMGLVALGAALAVIAIYFGLVYKPFEAVQVSLGAEPNAPVSGGEIVLNLTVTNNSNDPIENVNATFKLPAQIKLERSSLPYDRTGQTVNFGEIDARSDATVRLVGALSGAVGENLRPSATVTYKNNSGSVAKKSAVASVKIASSSVGAEFEMPDNILVGQVVNGDIRYFNHGNSPADNVVIAPDWPTGFVLTSSAPAIKNGAWFVGALAPGSEGKLSWSGMIGASDPSVDFGIETGIGVGTDVLTQSQTVKTVSVTDPGVSVTIDGASVARLGDTVALTATYKNSDDHTLNGTVVSVTADPGLTILNIDRANPGDIKPGDQGTIKIQVQVDSNLPDALKNSTDPQLAVRVSVNGNLDHDQAVTISSPAWNIKIASQLDLTSSARYWADAGDQLGRGPIPPAVGQMTSYWIFWNVENTTGAVTDVRVVGTLPANVNFTGKVSAPYGDAPIYDPSTRAVTWNAGDVPSWPGVTSSAFSTAFEISLVPTADQIGTYPKLMTGQNIAGTDTDTGIALQNSAPDLTAHLTSDPQGAATGTVK